ncbi:hypothetical protein B0H12DRAFT_1074829 [Mycena haematopus]|nr:hypothetical protein B0H12DRAFT_1074829 [Mycena haematopus]
MSGPTRNTRASPAKTKSYARRPLPQLTLVEQLNRIVAEDPTPKKRFDLNATASTDEPGVAICFTLKELESMVNPILVGASCTNCHLVVAPWGFGWYILDKKDNAFDLAHFICKACWRYSTSNPRFDWDEALMAGDLQAAPICTCPPGSMACQDVLTGCQLHNGMILPTVPAMTPAPQGCTRIRRPKMRAEVANDLDNLVKRREAAWEAVHERYELATKNGEVFDFDEYDVPSQKCHDALALRQKFRHTRLADFKMPASPPYVSGLVIEPDAGFVGLLIAMIEAAQQFRRQLPTE